MSSEKEINLLAEYGRTRTYMSSIVGCSVVVCCLTVGSIILYSTFKTKKNKVKILGEVVSCTLIGTSNSFNVQVRYFVNDKEYTGYVTSSSYKMPGSSIEVYYDANNPAYISDYSPISLMLGGTAIIICALLICSFIMYNLFTVQKYNQAAINSALPNYGYGFLPIAPTIKINTQDK